MTDDPDRIPIGTPHNGLGMDDDPRGGELTTQEAVDEIAAMYKRGQRDCFLPDDPEKNRENAGRVRALSQVLALLERAGLEPNEKRAEEAQDLATVPEGGEGGVE